MGLLPGGKFTHEFDGGIYLTVLFLKKKLKKREKDVTERAPEVLPTTFHFVG